MSQLRTIPLAIASVGMTVDGREITEQDIDDIVSTYNIKMYGARINFDHERDWSGWAAKYLQNIDLNGGMLGDVLAVTKAENDEGIICLYAVLAPNQSFVQLNQADQAVYFSVEITSNFRGSEKTYLLGLAVTDYPACTYTDRIKFNSKQTNFHKEKHEETQSLFAVELGGDFKKKPEKPPVLDRFKQLFTNPKDDEMKPEVLEQALSAALSEPLIKLSTAVAACTAASQQLIENFSSGDQNGDGPKKKAAKSEDLSSGDQNGDGPKNKIIESEEYKTLEEKYNNVETQLNELSEKFAKALKTPTGATNSEGEPQGDNEQFNGLL